VDLDTSATSGVLSLSSSSDTTSAEESESWNSDPLLPDSVRFSSYSSSELDSSSSEWSLAEGRTGALPFAFVVGVFVALTDFGVYKARGLSTIL